MDSRAKEDLKGLPVVRGSRYANPSLMTKRNSIDVGALGQETGSKIKDVPGSTSASKSALEWMDVTANQVSIHGLIWYTRVNNRWFRLILVVLTVVTVIGLPTFVSIKAYSFYHNTQVKTDTEWVVADKYPYPNITVCHPKFFSQAKLDGRSYIRFCLTESFMRNLQSTGYPISWQTTSRPHLMLDGQRSLKKSLCIILTFQNRLRL